VKELLNNELLKDEQILWCGQPETSILFSKADIFLVPFSLLWGGMAFFGIGSTLLKHNLKGNQALPFLPAIIFLVVACYITFGRFILKAYKKKRTYYFVTNKRVITLTDMCNRTIQAEFIDRTPSINKTVNSQGVGTVSFGNSNPAMAMYGNTGMDFFGSYYGPSSPIFYDIKDANRVYDMVNDIRKS